MRPRVHTLWEFASLLSAAACGGPTSRSLDARWWPATTDLSSASSRRSSARRSAGARRELRWVRSAVWWTGRGASRRRRRPSRSWGPRSGRTRPCSARSLRCTAVLSVRRLGRARRARDSSHAPCRAALTPAPNPRRLLRDDARAVEGQPGARRLRGGGGRRRALGEDLPFAPRLRALRGRPVPRAARPPQRRVRLYR